MAVFVLDRRGKPLMPCTEKRVRLLLARGRVRVKPVKFAEPGYVVDANPISSQRPAATTAATAA